MRRLKRSSTLMTSPGRSRRAGRPSASQRPAATRLSNSSSAPPPTFMPVGTLGTVKALTPADVRSTGARVVLSNTYHLSLQPGIETVERLGGLHAFMRWDGPILTDSGGFQVFSLDNLRQVSE